LRLLLVMAACGGQLIVAAQTQPSMPVHPAPRPVPFTRQRLGDWLLELYFADLSQGGCGLLRLSGAGIASAQLSFRERDIPFFSRDGDDWYAIVFAEMEASPGAYPMNIRVDSAGSAQHFSRDIEVRPGKFLAQALELPPQRAQLANAAGEAAEIAQLQQLSAESQPEPLWDARGFRRPLPGALTSPYGAVRIFNGTRRTRHTGWDQNAPVGSPVSAMAAGVVAFAAALDIRGNSVLIDHGLGIFSAYAHLSAIHVQAGQAVLAGQVIGDSGNSGRSIGAHLHWEIIVQGQWLDGRQFLDMWLPA